MVIYAILMAIRVLVAQDLCASRKHINLFKIFLKVLTGDLSKLILNMS